MARPRRTVHYRFDELNRLVTTVRDAGRLRTVEISEALLRIDQANRLVVEAGTGTRTARTLVLDGAWSLTPAHELALTLRRAADQERQTLVLAGALARAEAHQLGFELRTTEDAAPQLLALSGRWQADRRNRLSFLAERARGRDDRLTLQGVWEIGPDHALLYRYRRVEAGGRQAEERVLRFAGAWDLDGQRRLVYRLERSGDSAFAFTAAIQQAAARGARGRLDAEVAIGVSGRAGGRRRITLSGAWRIRPDLSLALEVPYAGGRVQAIRFEGAYALGPRNRIAVALQTGDRRPLGVTLTLSRALAPSAQAFVQLRRDGDERAAIAGAQVRF